MFRKRWIRIAGAILVLLSIALLVFTIVSVANGMAKEGPIAGKITSFKPAYPNQGLVIVLAGIASADFFLGGICCLAVGRKKD